MGKFTSDMWELLQDQLIKVQFWHVSVRRRNKGGKVRESWIMRVVDLVK